mmetsp:Transcript_33958/g.81476  ORF Transcript_33958/g.81476 Transcript_33958/m.81476 type:complete len:327 (+) Transcript_33958:736-1716(+)
MWGCTEPLGEEWCRDSRLQPNSGRRTAQVHSGCENGCGDLWHQHAAESNVHPLERYARETRKLVLEQRHELRPRFLVYLLSSDTLSPPSLRVHGLYALRHGGQSAVASRKTRLYDIRLRLDFQSLSKLHPSGPAVWPHILDRRGDRGLCVPCCQPACLLGHPVLPSCSPLQQVATLGGSDLCLLHFLVHCDSRRGLYRTDCTSHRDHHSPLPGDTKHAQAGPSHIRHRARLWRGPRDSQLSWHGLERKCLGHSGAVPGNGSLCSGRCIGTCKRSRSEIHRRGARQERRCPGLHVCPRLLGGCCDALRGLGRAQWCVGIRLLWQMAR